MREGNRPPWGWYRLPEDPSQQDYWGGSEWLGKPQPAEARTKPFPPGVLVVAPETHEDGTKTCPQCAERVQGAAVVCRFCGHRFDGTPPVLQPGEASTSGAAVAAFICSLIGLWIAGIPLGIHAQRQIDRSSGRLTGRGFATTAVILGTVGLLITLAVVVVAAAATQQ